MTTTQAPVPPHAIHAVTTDYEYQDSDDHEDEQEEQDTSDSQYYSDLVDLERVLGKSMNTTSSIRPLHPASHRPTLSSLCVLSSGLSLSAATHGSLSSVAAVAASPPPHLLLNDNHPPSSSQSPSRRRQRPRPRPDRSQRRSNSMPLGTTTSTSSSSMWSSSSQQQPSTMEENADRTAFFVGSPMASSCSLFHSPRSGLLYHRRGLGGQVVSMVVAPVAAREEASPQPGDDTATVASAPADSSHHHHHQSQTPITTTSLLQPIEASTEATSDTQSLLSQVLEHDDDDNDTNGNSSSDDDHSLLSLTDSREAPFLWEDPTFYARRGRSPKQPATTTTATTTSLTKPSWTTRAVPLTTISTRRSTAGQSTTDQPVPEPQPFAESPTQTIALQAPAPVAPVISTARSNEPTNSRPPSVEAACAEEKNQQPESHTPTIALDAPTTVAPVMSNAGSEAPTDSSTKNDTGSTKTESDPVPHSDDEKSCSKNLDENVSAQKVDDVQMQDTSLTKGSSEDKDVDDSTASVPSKVPIMPASQTEPTSEAMTQETKENLTPNVEVARTEKNQQDHCEQPESHTQTGPTSETVTQEETETVPPIVEAACAEENEEDNCEQPESHTQIEPTLKAVTPGPKEDVPSSVEAVCVEENQQDNCEQPESQAVTQETKENVPSSVEEACTEANQEEPESHKQTIALEAPTPVAPVVSNGSDAPTDCSHNNDQGSAQIESGKGPQSDQLKHTSITEGSSDAKDDDSTASVPSEVEMAPTFPTEPTSEAVTQETKENVPSSVEAACVEGNQQDLCKQPESQNQTIALQAPTPVAPVVSNGSDAPTDSSHNNDQGSAQIESDKEPHSDQLKHTSLTEGSSEAEDVDDSTASVPSEVEMAPAIPTEPTSEAVTQETKENVPSSVEAACVEGNQQDLCKQPESQNQTIALQAPTPVAPVVSNGSDEPTNVSHNNDQGSAKAESEKLPQSDDEKSSSKNLENNVSAKEVEEDRMKYSSITEGSSEDKDLDDSTASVPFEVVMVPATQTEPTSEVVTQETKENVPPSVEATFVGEYEQDNCDQWDCCSDIMNDNMGKQNANGTIKGMFFFEEKQACRISNVNSFVF